MKGTFKSVFSCTFVLIAAWVSGVSAATYACNGWRYDDGSGTSQVSKFIYTQQEISVNGVKLKYSGGNASISGSVRIEVLTQDLNENDNMFQNSQIYLLSTCTAEDDLIKSASKYECEQHDLVRVNDMFSYPKPPTFHQITRCTKF